MKNWEEAIAGILAGLAAFGLTWVTFSAGALGGIIAASLLNTVQIQVRLNKFFLSLIAAGCLTPSAKWYFEIKAQEPLVGVAFLIGLYGVSILTELNTLLQSGAAREWIKTVITKRLGG